jgi:hypothetical protein
MTKTDSVSRAELVRSIQTVYDELNNRNRHASLLTVHAVSSRTGDGILSLKKDIAQAVFMKVGNPSQGLNTEEEENS